MDAAVMEMEQRSIYLLDWEQFQFYWQDIADCLTKTDFHQFYTEEWLLPAVANKEVQVWALSTGIIRLVVFTRIIHYPCGTVLQLFWGYGRELDQFLEQADEMMERAARVVGAEKIEIVGRKGWIRKMKRFGFEVETYTISRPVGKKGRSH